MVVYTYIGVGSGGGGGKGGNSPPSPSFKLGGITTPHNFTHAYIVNSIAVHIVIF